MTITFTLFGKETVFGGMAVEIWSGEKSWLVRREHHSRCGGPSKQKLSLSRRFQLSIELSLTKHAINAPSPSPPLTIFSSLTLNDATFIFRDRIWKEKVVLNFYFYLSLVSLFLFLFFFLFLIEFSLLLPPRCLERILYYYSMIDFTLRLKYNCKVIIIINFIGFRDETKKIILFFDLKYYILRFFL